VTQCVSALKVNDSAFDFEFKCAWVPIELHRWNGFPQVSSGQQLPMSNAATSGG